MNGSPLLSIGPLDLIVSALAVFRLAVFIADDAFPPMMWVRERLLARWPSDDTLFHVSELTHVRDGVGQTRKWGRVVEQLEPRSEYFVAVSPYRWAKLITCIWCLSIWVGAAAVSALYWIPSIWTPFALVLALSAVAGLLNTLRTDR